MRLRLSAGPVGRVLRNEEFTPGRDLNLSYPIELDPIDYPLGTTLVSATLILAPDFGLPPVLVKQVTNIASVNGQISDTGADGIGFLQITVTGAELLPYGDQPLAFEVIVVDSRGKLAPLDAGALVPTPSMAGKPVDHLTLTPATFALTYPQTQPMTVTAYDVDGVMLVGRSVVWSSSDPGTATVDSNGVVSVIGAGAVTITASVEGHVATAAGTMIGPVDHVVLSPTPLSLKAYATQQLTATVYDANNNVLTGHAVTWSSANPARAGVDATGLVTAYIGGQVVVISGTVDGKTGTASVTTIVLTVAEFWAGFNARGTPAADLWIDASSPVAAVAAVGAASLTTVVDGTMPSGKKCNKWESFPNPGTGKHWRPSADYTPSSGTGANSDGISVKGAGLELPPSVGYSGAGCHPEDTAISATTPGSVALKEYLNDYTSGMQWIVVCKPKLNTNAIYIGEPGDIDQDALTVSSLIYNSIGTHDDPGLAGWFDDLATGAARARAVIARWMNPTTTKGIVAVDRVGRDFFNPYGGPGIWDGVHPALNSARRVRLGLDVGSPGGGGWSLAPNTEYNLVMPVPGKSNGAQWKFFCDVVESWWPDMYTDMRASLLLFGGDSQESTLWGPGTWQEQQYIMSGQDGSPAVPNAALSCFPQAGNNIWQLQWPFLRQVADGDTSLRTHVGLLEGEFLNDETTLSDNYFVHDWWRAHGSKWKSVIYDFAVSAYTNAVAGNANRADVAANWASHADAHFDPQTGFAPWFPFNLGDLHDSAEGGHAYPIGENPIAWVSIHITQEMLRGIRQGIRSALRFLAGLDPSNDGVRATLTPDHVTLTVAAPSTNPTITTPVNWLGVPTTAKTWVHDTILVDGSSAAAIATVDADGTLHRVAAGHCWRRSISNDGARVYVDVNVPATPALLTDTFTRANNATVVGTPDVGNAWGPQINGAWGIQTNRMYSSSGSGIMLMPNDLGASNYAFAMDIITSPTANRVDCGLAICIVDLNNFIWLEIAKASGPGNLVRLAKFQGAFTLLATGSGVTVAENTTYRPTITKSGNAIQIAMPGLTTINYTLSGAEIAAFAGVTKVGAFLNVDPTGDDGGTRFDNASAT